MNAKGSIKLLPNIFKSPTEKQKEHLQWKELCNDDSIEKDRVLSVYDLFRCTLRS